MLHLKCCNNVESCTEMKISQKITISSLTLKMALHENPGTPSLFCLLFHDLGDRLSYFFLFISLNPCYIVNFHVIRVAVPGQYFYTKHPDFFNSFAVTHMYIHS